MAEDALFRECLLFVQDQSAGEWGEQVERADAEKLATFVRTQIAAARPLIERPSSESDASVELLRAFAKKVASLPLGGEVWKRSSQLAELTKEAQDILAKLEQEKSS